MFTASTDKTLGIWDFETGTRIKKLKGHSSFVNSCFPSRRGPQYIVSGADDCTVKVCLVEKSSLYYRIVSNTLFLFIHQKLILPICIKCCLNFRHSLDSPERSMQLEGMFEIQASCMYIRCGYSCML